MLPILSVLSVLTCQLVNPRNYTVYDLASAYDLEAPNRGSRDARM